MNSLDGGASVPKALNSDKANMCQECSLRQELSERFYCLQSWIRVPFEHVSPYQKGSHS